MSIESTHRLYDWKIFITFAKTNFEYDLWFDNRKRKTMGGQIWWLLGQCAWFNLTILWTKILSMTIGKSFNKKRRSQWELQQQQSQDWENTNPQLHQGGARMQSGEWRIDLGSATRSASLWWCWTKWKKWICRRSSSRSWWVAANSMFPRCSRDRRTSPLRPCQRLKHALAFRFYPHPRCRAIHRYIPTENASQQCWEAFFLIVPWLVL